MATTTTVSSNYAGKAAGEIIGAAFREADTLRLNLLTVAENVKSHTQMELQIILVDSYQKVRLL